MSLDKVGCDKPISSPCSSWNDPGSEQGGKTNRQNKHLNQFKHLRGIHGEITVLKQLFTFFALKKSSFFPLAFSLLLNHQILNENI